MKSKIEFFQDLLIKFFIILITFSFIFLIVLTPNDELWNFQNIYKMFNNFTIYKDANVIITPIFFYIGNLLFHIFSANYIVFRIYNILIYSLIFFIIYKIFKNLKAAKNLNILYITLIFLMIFQVIVAGANYNALAILFCLIGLNLYISKKSNNFLQGILIFLIFFTKQNIGIYYAITILLYELHLENFSKKYILNQFKKFLFFIIPSAVLILKLYLDNNLFYFINYCFGGLFEFGNSNIVVTAPIYYFLIPISTLGIYIFTKIKKNTLFKEMDNMFFENLTLLFYFSIGMTFIIFPILNSAHFICAFPFHLIFLFYYFDALILKDFFENEKYNINIKWFSIAILFFIIVRTLYYFYSDYSDLTHYVKNDSPFNNLFMYDTDAIKISILTDYITQRNNDGVDVIILSYDAALPMIELKQSHGMYDLFFNGNLGYNGKEKIKNDVQNLENTEFLVVTNEDDIFIQEPPEIREYIMKNLNYKGTICNYSIYSK